VAMKKRPPLMHAPRPLPSEGTHTAALLRLLDCNGPMMTSELASATMMSSRQIWAPDVSRQLERWPLSRALTEPRNA